MSQAIEPHVLHAPMAPVTSTSVDPGQASQLEGGKTEKHVWPWLRAGVQALGFRSPPWADLGSPTPLVLLALMLLLIAVWLGVQRLYIIGPADFSIYAVDAGWWSSLLTAWGCVVLCWRSSVVATNKPAPRPLGLFAVCLSIEVALTVLPGLVWVPIVRLGVNEANPAVSALSAAFYWGLPAWTCAAFLMLGWRASANGAALPGWRWAGLLALVAAILLPRFAPSHDVFYPARADDDGPQWRLTDELLAAQSQTLDRQLDELKPPRKGLVDVYVVTYAPYGDEDVFRKETELVGEVLQTRLGAEGKVLHLLTHPRTLDVRAMATPANLRKAIEHIASKLDPAEDVLYVHLSSHGGRDGKLASQSWPVQVTPLTPQALQQMLKAAQVGPRVVVVSACYSGTWLNALSDPRSLVMTASDADHTSYGCGTRSEMTYFGRALYDDALRQTPDFEMAFQTARRLIDEREKAVGKPDGYSNPQIVMGEQIRTRLQRLSAELARQPK